MLGPDGTLAVKPAASGEIAEAALDGGVLHPVTGPVVVHREGSHWLAVAARNAAGTFSPIRWLHVIVDSTPPAVQVEVNPQPVANAQGAWVPRGATVEATARDALSGLGSMTLEAGGPSTTSATSPVSITLDHEGTVKISARAQDRVGNGSRPVSRTLLVDGTPPDLSLTLSGQTVNRNSALIGGPHVTVIAKAKDAGSGVGTVSYTLDNNPIPADKLTGPWSKGSHTLLMVATDRVGNRATTGLTFTIDATPPAMSCSIEGTGVRGADGQLWYRPHVPVLCTADDPVAGLKTLEWKQGSEGWKTAHGPVPLLGTSITTRAIDGVGNRSVHEWTFRIDGSPPGVIAVLPNRKRVNPGSTLSVPLDVPIHVAVRDEGCGAGTARFRVNRGHWAPLPDHIVFRNGQVFELDVEACDRLRNCAPASWPVHIIPAHERRER